MPTLYRRSSGIKLYDEKEKASEPAVAQSVKRTAGTGVKRASTAAGVKKKKTSQKTATRKTSKKSAKKK